MSFISCTLVEFAFIIVINTFLEPKLVNWWGKLSKIVKTGMPRNRQDTLYQEVCLLRHKFWSFWFLSGDYCSPPFLVCVTSFLCKCWVCSVGECPGHAAGCTAHEPVRVAGYCAYHNQPGLHQPTGLCSHYVERSSIHQWPPCKPIYSVAS